MEHASHGEISVVAKGVADIFSGNVVASIVKNKLWNTRERKWIESKNVGIIGKSKKIEIFKLND